MNVYKNQYVTSQHGFTLLDLAIILLVIGFITAPILNEYNNWKKRSDIDQTQQKIADIESALEQYFFENEYYPCPADPTIGPETIVPVADPQFGEENREAAVAPLVGNCIQVGAPQPVIHGAVPFKALGLEEKQVLDGWRRKISYSVTVGKTHPNTYAASLGAITVNKPQREFEDPLDPGRVFCIDNFIDPGLSDIDLILMSHGPTGAGAYNNQGTLINACPAVVDVDGDGVNDGDGENCNNDPIFRFPECATNTSNGPQFYDDISYALYNNKWNRVPSRLWERGDDARDTGSNAGFFGIGTGDPQRALDVIGNIKATNSDTANDATDNKLGNALADQYCDSNGENCFESNSIAGDDPSMRCGGLQQGITGIQKNETPCLTLPAAAFSCPEGKYLVAINDDGTVECSL